MENVESLDVSQIPNETLATVEADCYWCLTALLDDIQVSGMSLSWADILNPSSTNRTITHQISQGYKE